MPEDEVIHVRDGAVATVRAPLPDGTIGSIQAEDGESVGRAILRLRRRAAEKGKGPAPLPHRRKRP